MNTEEKYKSVKIVSILFPIIGLIIYAVNIGKNDELAKLALKWAIRSFVVCVSIIVFIFLFVVIMNIASYSKSNTISGNTKVDPQTVEIHEVFQEALIGKLLNEKNVEDVTIKINDKIVYINITLNENGTREEGINVSNMALNYFGEREKEAYDIQFFIENESLSILGYKKTTSKQITWTN